MIPTEMDTPNALEKNAFNRSFKDASDKKIKRKYTVTQIRNRASENFKKATFFLI